MGRRRIRAFRAGDSCSKRSVKEELEIPGSSKSMYRSRISYKLLRSMGSEGRKLGTEYEEKRVHPCWKCVCRTELLGSAGFSMFYTNVRKHVLYTYNDN